MKGQRFRALKPMKASVQVSEMRPRGNGGLMAVTSGSSVDIPVGSMLVDAGEYYTGGGDGVTVTHYDVFTPDDRQFKRVQVRPSGLWTGVPPDGYLEPWGAVPTAPAAT